MSFLTGTNSQPDCCWQGHPHRGARNLLQHVNTDLHVHDPLRRCRFNHGGVTSVAKPLMGGDAVSDLSTTFSATMPESTTWGSYAVPLIG